MPYGRFRPRMRMRRRRTFSPALVHVPASIGQAISVNTALLVFAVVATVTAGTSATNTRTDSDRDREVSTGHKVGRVIFNVTMTPTSGVSGPFEYIIFKIPRCHTVPAIGTAPVPSNASMLSVGSQQAWRIDAPGWVLKFGIIPVSAELPTTRQLSVNLQKFKMGTIKDGDHMGICLFNRSGASTTTDVHMRYKEWS